MWYDGVLVSGVPHPVVSQSYRSLVVDESVLSGNSAILKCVIPSFVADFVTVTSWHEENFDQRFLPSLTIGTHRFCGFTGVQSLSFFLAYREVH